MTHRFDPSSLREYDIRGIVGKTLSTDDARAIGRSFGTVVRAFDSKYQEPVIEPLVPVEEEITAPQLSTTDRKYVLLQTDPANTADLYFGGPQVTADATTRGGILVHPDGFLELALGESATLYVISTAASQKLRVLESA